ncbi:thymidine phosphorylase [Cochlodiniinecator piscidefendens]|uniref:thymidine phosphorylase n=1 Tax=Cochlodiniinecator piscidefendens TaxID=2715756 RepID=UPI00140D0D2D|nr:thymidine phosphorylase [Cochlodiniinecator piscidefendens]
MDAQSIIAKCREGLPLSPAETQWFAKGLATSEVTDAQAGAFAMAVCLNGMTDEARVHLTEAMRDSGDVLNWDLPGPIVDKHSTGGVGDCVSLILAPALAACGAYVPMISGRGLGHTGGTLDKLEAIPGVQTEVSEAKLREMVSEVGVAIVGATGNIAPADKRLYAIRDVTATVQSVDLITASILSKKLAAGLDGLVLDVKCGSGAFMKTQAEATQLAHALVSTANGAGCKTQAVITDMSQPLASAAGNALEIVEVMNALGGDLASPLAQLSIAQGGMALLLAGLAETEAQGKAMMSRAISSGEALERFSKMMHALGGPADFSQTWQRDLPVAPVKAPLVAPHDGYVSEIETDAIGMAVVRLGGGRLVGGQALDYSVGVSQIAGLGTKVGKGDVLAYVNAESEDSANQALLSLSDAFRVAPVADVPPLILQKVFK